MTTDQAEALAARILAAIDEAHPLKTHARLADRERVASDLAGLRECWAYEGEAEERHLVPHARRYADNLRRTADLYGVTTTP